MSTEVGSIHYALNLATGSFDRAVSSVNNSIDNMAEKFRSATPASQAVAKGLAVVGTALFGVIAKSTLTAARTETLGIAMRAVAKATKTSWKELRKQEAIMKKQGITTQESRAILSKFMQSQLDVAQASKIARVAQDLAVIAGENSSETAGKLTEAIANQNVLMLRQYGIVVNADDIFTKYAKTLGKSTDNLTAVEKKQAFVNAIMEAGSRVAGTYEMAMGTVGKKLTTLPRLFEEAANAIGERFLPVFGGLIDGLSNFLKNIITENIDKFIQRVKDAERPIMILSGAILFSLVPALVSAIGNFIGLFTPLAPFIVIGAVIGLLISRLAENMGGWGNFIKFVKDKFDELVITWETKVLPRLKDIWRMIVEKVIWAFNGLRDIVLKVIEDMGGLDAIITTVKDVAAMLWAGIKHILLPAFIELWEAIRDELIPELKELWKNIAPLLIPILYTLAHIIGGILLGAAFLFINGLKLIVKAITWVSSTLNDWFEVIRTVPILIKNQLSRVYENFIDPFRRAFNWVIDHVTDVVLALQRLNPFHKESPSLVDNVIRGMGIIRQQYASIGNIDFPTASQIVSPNISQISDSIPSIMPSMARSAEIHIHAGTVIANDYSIRELGRMIQKEVQRDRE